MAVKAIQLLVNSVLPDDLKDYTRSYNKASINALMTDIAEKHPDEYADIVSKISDIGRKAAYYNGETITLNDLRPSFDRKPLYARMDSEINAIKKNVKNETEKAKLIKGVYEKYATLMEDLTFDAEKQRGTNNLYTAVSSGARGNKTQLKMMLSSPGVYTDYKGETIPLFLKKSYSEGLSPAEYLASTYGTRNSVVTIKRSTAEAGGTAKELGRVIANMVVNKDKDYSDNGIDLDIDEDSVFGRVLARPVADLKAGTLIDRDTLNYLRKKGVKKVIVHSPIATISPEGISAEAFGMDFNHRLPKIGSHLGYMASTSMGEPLAQGSLNAKHLAGAFQGKKVFSGLPYIQSFLESPLSFKDKAAVSEIDGSVQKIYDAPQGGKYIVINGKEHYVLPDMEIFVKPGDKVEAGEIISDGLADPEDIVRLRGIGEGRRYVSERFKQLLDDSGAKVDRRNIELFARGFVDKLKVTDPDGVGDYLPGDIISYNALESDYTPNDDTKPYQLNDETVIGKFLQKPVLHYTIGTKLTPKMINRVKESGIADKVYASAIEPGFEPVLIRLREVSTKGNPDFIFKGTAAYQKSNYIDSAIKGDEVDIKENSNPLTRMAFPDFAEKVWETGKY